MTRSKTVVYPSHPFHMISPIDIRKQLYSYGARASDIVLLDESAEPVQRIRYLDLIRRPQAQNDVDSLWPQAVVEMDGRPIVYVVSTPSELRPNDSKLTRLRRMLAFRAGADYVALSSPGRLTVYPVAPMEKGELPSKTLREAQPEAAALIPSLAYPSGEDHWDQRPSKIVGISASLHQFLFELLSGSTQEIRKYKVEPLDALSLVGRALFLRFLVDRHVLSDEQVQKVCGAPSEQCFADAKRAALISAWLDKTFNGDFLPLGDQGSEAWFRSLPAGVFYELGNILHHATGTGQLHLTWGTTWDDLLFDHIPVGLISQVYENHAHSMDASEAERTSIYYTPGHIAEYMVDEVFFALGDGAARARVLDPAVGGGVFLVAAFRRLAAERWKVDGKPPDTKTLREILYHQLQGFDIQPSALRLCSLALYLTAIELDPNPRPASKLRFDKALLGSVLQDVRSENPRHVYLGSLDPERVGPEHNGQYDVVIGNPPWTMWKATGDISSDHIKKQKQIVERAVNRVLKERLDNKVSSYKMTGIVPDIPFVWRAMEWAKPGGWIALSLHGRLLFRQKDQGIDDRNDIFRAITITGVLNGASLRDTTFWPEVRAPFCLLFGRNEPATENASFWYISPELEKGLNDRGSLRIDDRSAQPVSVTDLLHRPWLLKALFRGTELDISVLETLERSGYVTIEDYWIQKGWEKRYGQGFKVGGISRPRRPASDLWDMPELTKHDRLRYLIEPSQLRRVEYSRTMQYSRDRDIYRAPLVLIPESPPVDRSGPAACISFDDIAFNQSFTGLSCAGYAEPRLLAEYLFLLLNSALVSYFALIKGGRFGIERDLLLVEDIYHFPFRILDDLPAKLRNAVPDLSKSLIAQGSGALPEVDSWAADVYGLSKVDLEVIHDTLSVSLPFASSRSRAQGRPKTEEIDLYIQRLQKTINPLLHRRGRQVSARVLRNKPGEAWILLQLDSHLQHEKPPALLEHGALHQLIDEADSLAATSLFAVRPPSTLLIAIVAQYRYFTPSRARMLGLDIVQEHEAVLLGEAHGA